MQLKARSAVLLALLCGSVLGMKELEGRVEPPLPLNPTPSHASPFCKATGTARNGTVTNNATLTIHMSDQYHMHMQ